MKPCKLTIAVLVNISLFSSICAHASTNNTPYSWTGFYAGLNAGVVKHTLNITDIQATSFYATIQETANPSFTGGFQAGYRRQLNPTQVSGVYGIEFSADFSNASFEKVYGSPYALYQFKSTNALKNLFLLQAVGGIAAERTFLFLAAGLSWTNITGRITNMDNAPFFDSFNINKTRVGTSLSGGIEYAVSTTISARFKVDVITPNTYSVSNDTNDHFQIANTIVQGTFGINYHFG